MSSKKIMQFTLRGVPFPKRVNKPIIPSNQILDKQIKFNSLTETETETDTKISSKLNQYKTNTNLNDPVELEDLDNNKFFVKKCFVKHLISKIFHNISLPTSEVVCDIVGKLHTLNPNDKKIYKKLIEISSVGEILFSDDNRFVVSFDTENKKHFINKNILFNGSTSIYNSSTKGTTIKLKTQTSENKSFSLPSLSSRKNRTKNSFHEITITKDSIQRDGIVYVKIYDVQNNSYLIPEGQILTLFENLIHKDIILPKISLTNAKGEKLIFNLNKIRSKEQNYYEREYKYKTIVSTRDSGSSKPKTPYIINNEEGLSYFEITNCLNGQKLFIKTWKICKLIYENVGKDFIFPEPNNKIKLCVEELKETLKQENKSKEYIKIKNVVGEECYIKKFHIFNYIKKMIDNKPNVDEIMCLDIYRPNEQLFFNMKELSKTLIKIAPYSYIQDDILKDPLTTYIITDNGFMQVENESSNELFEFIKLVDENQNEVFVRKPFIRNILFNSRISKDDIPSYVEVYDYRQKKRKIFLRKLIQEFSKKKAKGSNVSVRFYIKEACLEVDYLERSYLIPKVEIRKIKETNANNNNGLTKILTHDFNYKTLEINLEAIREVPEDKEWIIVEDVNYTKAVLYKSIIKSIIIGSLFENKKYGKNYVEVYDYNCEKRKIYPESIVNSYTYSKSQTQSGKIILEVYNKNSSNIQI